MISINSLNVEFSSKPLFSNISFVINSNDKIALTGKNGAGKSTLLKIIAGLQSPTSGSIGKPSEIKIGYLPQQMEVSDDTTLLEETRKAFGERISMEKELEEVNKKLETSGSLTDTELQDLIGKADNLNNQLMLMGGESGEAEIEKTLVGLGFKRTDFNRPTSEFSGGWRMRIELAKILLRNPDILLLDEPTNHLDIESIQWLEKFLKTKGKAALIVSHDRAFLDNVTKRTVEISCGKIYDYKVSYSDFVKLRSERLEQQRRAYENQQKLINDTKDFIERFRYKATKAIQVQSRIKQLEKIELIEIDQTDNSRLRLKFPPAERSGDYPLIVDNLSKSYGEHKVIGNVELTLKRGDKVAFVGKNGEGKSTLVKCIMNEIDYDGNLKTGHNVKIGYFAQNQAQTLDESLTVFQTIDNVAIGEIRTKINDLLGSFMFGGEASEKKVKVLSGGEKSRLAMIKLLLEPVNFLILDEPTNHLDMRTKDILKEALKDFTGTLIVVSHDREFLDGLVDRVYEFGNGKVREHLGGIYDYIEQKNHELALDPNGFQPHNISDKGMPHDLKKSAANVSEIVSESNSKLSYQLQKQKEKELKRAEKNLKDAELQINVLEEKIEGIELKISQGTTEDGIFEEYGNLKKELEEAMTKWEEAELALDEIKSADNK